MERRRACRSPVTPRCLGEHSLAILKEAGVCAAADIDALLKSGATIDGEAEARAEALHRAALP